MFLCDNDQKIVIRTIAEADLDQLWQVSYRDHLEWLDWNGPYFNDPIYTQTEFLEKIGLRYVDDPLMGAIFYENQLIGTVSAYWEDGKLRRWLECGIVIYPPDFWAKGIGTTALELWITYLFEEFPWIERVGYTTWSGNDRMMRVGEKLGMTLEARLRKVRYWKDRYYDSVKYGVLRDEWSTVKK